MYYELLIRLLEILVIAGLAFVTASKQYVKILLKVVQTAKMLQRWYKTNWKWVSIGINPMKRHFVLVDFQLNGAPFTLRSIVSNAGYPVVSRFQINEWCRWLLYCFVTTATYFKCLLKWRVLINFLRFH